MVYNKEFVSNKSDTRKVCDFFLLCCQLLYCSLLFSIIRTCHFLNSITSANQVSVIFFSFCLYAFLISVIAGENIFLEVTVRDQSIFPDFSESVIFRTMTNFRFPWRFEKSGFHFTYGSCYASLEIF